MSEILQVFKRTGTAWLILGCGHWYHWDNAKAPKVGAAFGCPACKPLPSVVPIVKP